MLAVVCRISVFEATEAGDRSTILDFVHGYFEWFRCFHIIETSYLHNMGRFDAFCQSCGMPLDQDPGKGGTNQDGSRSSIYCSYCYADGQFRDNFTSADQMVAFSRSKLKEMGFGPIRRWLFTLHIPMLGRWKKKW